MMDEDQLVKTKRVIDCLLDAIYICCRQAASNTIEMQQLRIEARDNLVNAIEDMEK